MGQRIGIILLGQELDTHGDESIQVTSKVKDFQDISKLFSDVSTQFSLPASAKNNEIFQQYWKFNIDSVNNIAGQKIDYRLKQPCKLEVDGVPYKEGLLRLNSISMKDGRANNYNCIWTSYIATLNDRFGTDKIGQLDWGYLNHSISRGYEVSLGLSVQVPNLFDNKIIYPLITDAPDEWTVARLELGTPNKEFKPAVQVVEIFKAIQLKYDLVFNMPMLSEDRLTKMYMWLPNVLDDEIDPLLTSRGTIMDLTSNTPIAPYNGMEPVVLEENYIRSAFLQPQFNTNQGFRFEFTLTPKAGSTTKPYTVRTYMGLPEVKNWTLMDPVKNFTGTGTQTWNFTMDASLYGKVFKWWATANNSGDSISYDATIKCYATWNGTETLATTVTLADNIVYDPAEDLSSTFPDVQVIDFLANFIKLYNLVIIPTSANSFNIKPYEEWRDEGKLVDLSKYADIAEYIINTIEVPKALVFEYEDPTAANNVKFKQLTGEAYGDEHLYTVGEATEYSIKPKKFENLLWDRLDGAEPYYVGKAVEYADVQNIDNLTPAISNAYLFYWGTDITGANIKISGTTDYNVTEYKMGDSYYPTINPTDTLNFGGELNAFTTIAAPNDVNLISKYYNITVARMLDSGMRKYDFKFIMGFPIFSKLSLNSIMKIGDNYFSMDEIGYNMLTSEVNIKAYNTLRSVQTIFPPPAPNPPVAGNISLSNKTDSSISLSFAPSSGDNSLVKLELFQDAVLKNTMGPTVISVTVNGLNSNTTYQFYNIITDSQGLTDQSNVLTVTTLTTPPVGLTAFTMNPIGYVNEIDACFDNVFITRWHDGAGIYPTDFDKVYNTDNVNDPFDGANFKYKMSNSDRVEILNDGTVIFNGFC